MKKKIEHKDIRTLCFRCARDMTRAGVKLAEHNKQKSKCDKCGWVGHDYEVKYKKHPPKRVQELKQGFE